ncbi:PREDICTED: copine-1-like [Amphimedon queenslandica]|uniref:Copine C-terminal domain-containing protein n=1 Tax=Amphimedon queenslandica TaxID=400682 RepID=A0A1X7V4L9_AMPQE|nr:PREDICTED: copine-1-like [Amphimedon queenslandica]|eukprot:XP_011403245.2 PREDICTED: copine-1-like [Amphimedon queenslandica]
MHMQLKFDSEIFTLSFSDKLFPSFGFGGQIEGKVSHRFPLNFNPTNPYCAGVEGIVAAYHQALRVVDLLGPTNMAPIINHVADFAEEAASKTDRQDYFVLLILTDGEITDMIDTKKAIIRASRLPMSIIIVGVGSCTFLKMVELDSDDSLLRVGSSVAERDIVQFVPYRKYAQSYELAQVVLAEIPTQFTQYMNKRGLAPLKGAQ